MVVAAPPSSAAAARSVLLLLPRWCASKSNHQLGGLRLYRSSPASCRVSAIYGPPPPAAAAAGLLRPNAAAYSYEKAASGTDEDGNIVGAAATAVKQLLWEARGAVLLTHPPKPKGAPGKPMEGAVRKAPPSPPPPGPPAEGTGGGGGHHN